MPIIRNCVKKNQFVYKQPISNINFKIYLSLEYVRFASKPCGAPYAMFISLKLWKFGIISSAIYTCIMMIINHYIYTQFENDQSIRMYVIFTSLKTMDIDECYINLKPNPKKNPSFS